MAATFGWLCVETCDTDYTSEKHLAATFGWLCVETLHLVYLQREWVWQPPSGGCVLKRTDHGSAIIIIAAATFGWLCVETIIFAL